MCDIAVIQLQRTRKTIRNLANSSIEKWGRRGRWNISLRRRRLTRRLALCQSLNHVATKCLPLSHHRRRRRHRHRPTGTPVSAVTGRGHSTPGCRAQSPREKSGKPTMTVAMRVSRSAWQNWRATAARTTSIAVTRITSCHAANAPASHVTMTTSPVPLLKHQFSRPRLRRRNLTVSSRIIGSTVTWRRMPRRSRGLATDILGDHLKRSQT